MKNKKGYTIFLICSLMAVLYIVLLITIITCFIKPALNSQKQKIQIIRNIIHGGKTK